MVKNPSAMRETQVWSLGREDPLEKGMATHSCILAWRIPWTEGPDRLQSMGVTGRYDWVTNTYIHSQLPDSAVIVSREQQRDSAIHIQVSILPQTLLPSRLPCNIEQSPTCYTVGSSWLIHFKYSSVYMSIQNSLSPPFFLLATISSFS